MSTTSSANTGRLNNKFCKCGEAARVRTAWTDDNPGRRFYGCKFWTPNGGGCGFFDWYNPAFPPRAKQIINNLLSEKKEFGTDLKEVEEDMAEAKKELKKELKRAEIVIRILEQKLVWMNNAMVLSWIGFISFVFIAFLLV